MADPTLPPPGTAGPGWSSTLNAAVLDTSRRADIVYNPQFGGYYLDSPRYTGTDQQRLAAAMTDQQASGGVTNMAPIILPSRPISLTAPFTLYQGLKIIGPWDSGQKNAEVSSGNFVGPEITLGGTLGSGANSLFVSPGGQMMNVYMANFSVQGAVGSSLHQFLHAPNTGPTGGTLYACTFHALTFNFMRSVFGLKTLLTGFTQVALTGVWTINNLWDTQVAIGGSDNQLWVGGLVNVGPSQSSAQTGTYADNDYQMLFSSLSKTDVGYIYISALNGWRGMRVTGAASSLSFFGGVYEGYKPSGTTQGGQTLAAPGTVFRIDGGTVKLDGARIGQGMAAPDAAENGLIQVNGGEVAIRDCHIYGANMATANAIHHTGGRLRVDNLFRVGTETWTNRPRVNTTAPSASTSTTATYTYDGDSSVTVV